MEPFDITSKHNRKAAFRDLRNLLLFTGVLWAALLIPPPPDGPPGPLNHLLPEGVDKVVHGALFALESYFLHRFFRHRLSPSSAVGLTWALGLAMAGLTELCQTAVPGRSADFWDVVADGVGILAWWLWSLASSE